MRIDSVFTSYYEGNWNKLVSIVREQMADLAGAGNVVCLSRAFSYYGVVGIISSNDFSISTLYRQIDEEYADAEDDPRIKASYARFLALYHSFYGQPEDASKYYMKARLFYRSTDWYTDEALTLLESVYWFYLFADDSSELYSIIGRLEILNSYLEGYLDGDLKLINSIVQKSCPLKIENVLPCINLHMKNFSMMSKMFVAFIGLRDAFHGAGYQVCDKHTIIRALGIVSGENKEECVFNQMVEGMLEALELINQKDFHGLERIISTLRAKSEIFGHPWYRQQLGTLQSQLAEVGNKPQLHSNNEISGQHFSHDVSCAGGNNLVARISVSLFDKCQLSCRDATLNIDDFRIRTGKELLIYLVTRTSLQVHKDALVELFFQDESPEKSYNRLYVNIHRLNKALQENFASLSSSSFIFVNQGTVCINMDLLEEIDTQKYRKVLSVANQLWTNDREASLELMKQGVEMYSADIAPGFYYLDWLENYRFELKNMQTKALHRIFQYYLDSNIPGACTEMFYRLIELDALNENYYIEYFNYILRDERDAEALGLYRQYEARLKKELGISPSPKLKRIVTRTAR